MCPDTTTAFTLGMNDTVSALGLGEDSIMNFDIIPWGNSYYNNSKCGVSSYNKSYSMFCWVEMCDVENPPVECWEGHVMCQHNDNECYMMMYQECALEAGGIEEGYDFYGCLTQKESMAWRNGESGRVLLETAAHQCTSNEAIHHCFKFNSGEPASRNIWKHYALRTLKLGTSRKGTPWILVNGEVVDHTNLLDAVCDAYDGAPPLGCTQRRETFSFQKPTGKAIERRRKDDNITLLEITYYERDNCEGDAVLSYYVDMNDNCNQGFYLDRVGVQYVYDSAEKKLSYNEYTDNTCGPDSLAESTPLDFSSCSKAGFNWNTYRLVAGPVDVKGTHLTLDIGYANPTCDFSGWYGFSIVKNRGSCQAYCKDYDNVRYAQEERCSPFTFPESGRL